LTIGCDLFLNLKLYHLPNSFLQTFNKIYPNYRLIEFNTPTAKVTDPTEIDIYWGNRINKKIIVECSSLKWIHFGSVGVNTAVMSEVVEREIRLSNSRDIMTDAVVATGLAFIFSLSRGFHRAWHLQKNDQFNRESFDKYFDQIQDVFGRSVLIAGYGEIGQKFASVCNDLGLKVSVVRKHRGNKPDWIKHFFSLNELNTAVQDMDYVVNLLPLTDETKEVFTKNIFKNMKQNSFFINIGRGDTVVEDDLLSVLKNNVISGAGIDVFSSASYVNPSLPLRSDSPFMGLDNVILTPHIAGLTNRYWDKECALFLENLERFRNGKDLVNEIFKEQLISIE
jgi:phosphoglycerate dehydrogenase-like enzyme